MDTKSQRTARNVSETSLPIIGLIFIRNYLALLDTANGTITLHRVEKTLALTDEMKKVPTTATSTNTNYPNHTITTNIYNQPKSHEKHKSPKNWHSPATNPIR